MSPSLPLTRMPAIDVDRVLADIRRLSSDEFGGRAPGSTGETLTVQYLIDRFSAEGLEPGHPDGGWTQAVPLAGIAPSGFSPLVIEHEGRQSSFRRRDDFVAFSERVTERISLDRSDAIFVGYGVQAPEYGWDDFKGVDVSGKTLIVLVSDPPVALDPAQPDVLDPAMFNGRAMTYYGRWTYKYEKAAELGAAAVFIVHETGPAGYEFAIVQGMEGERFGLVTPDRNMRKPAVEGWLTLDTARAIVAASGLDFDQLKRAACTRDFAPVRLGASASLSFNQALRIVDSANVVAKLPGADPAVANECVIYMAHWDHLGVGAPVDGDSIYSGARDNASGTAMLIELARAFKAVQPAPRRTVLFLATTAEEQGLLGSSYYASFPLYPLERTLAVINVDELNIWGRTRDLTIIGLGMSDLDAYARDAAAEQGRQLRGDPEPEKGFYFRADHFSFAKAGVPALSPECGVDFVDKPAGYADEIREAWNQTYHRPADKIRDWWDLQGAADDAQVLFAVGYRVANADAFPEWSSGSEFRATRAHALQRR